MYAVRDQMAAAPATPVAYRVDDGDEHRQGRETPPEGHSPSGA